MNDDMSKIMSSLQLQFLNLVGEQVEDKDLFFQDLNKILSLECKVPDREAAEKRIKEEVFEEGRAAV